MAEQKQVVQSRLAEQIATDLLYVMEQLGGNRSANEAAKELILAAINAECYLHLRPRGLRQRKDRDDAETTS